MELINLTPHPLVFVREQGEELLLAPAGEPVRVEEQSREVGRLAGLPVKVKKFGALMGLPEPREGTYYVVSALAAQAAWAAGRIDVLAVGDPKRDPDGRIVGAAALCCHPDLEKFEEE